MNITIADAQQAYVDGLADKIKASPLRMSDAMCWATARLLTLAIQSSNEIVSVVSNEDVPELERQNGLLLLKAMHGLIAVLQDDITHYMEADRMVR